jgi:hypothetical protein
LASLVLEVARKTSVNVIVDVGSGSVSP